jgi:hypothetical protein
MVTAEKGNKNAQAEMELGIAYHGLSVKGIALFPLQIAGCPCGNCPFYCPCGVCYPYCSFGVD